MEYKLENNEIVKDNAVIMSKEYIVSELNRLEKKANQFEYMQKQAFNILKETVYGKEYGVNLEVYCYPQTCGSTNPFGCGGCAITSFTITCFLNASTSECVLFLCGRPQYHEKFEMCMRYKGV